jgi:antitoxin FitA
MKRDHDDPPPEVEHIFYAETYELITSIDCSRIYDCIATNLKCANMPSITVRNVSEEVHRALRVRAANHGRSAEAEIRIILEDAVQAKGRVKLGSLLAQIGRESGGFEINSERSIELNEPISFE